MLLHLVLWCLHMYGRSYNLVVWCVSQEVVVSSLSDVLDESFLYIVCINQLCYWSWYILHWFHFFSK